MTSSNAILIELLLVELVEGQLFFEKLKLKPSTLNKLKMAKFLGKNQETLFKVAKKNSFK